MSAAEAAFLLSAVAQLLSEVGLDFFFVLGFLFRIGLLVVLDLDLFHLESVTVLVVVGSAA